MSSAPTRSTARYQRALASLGCHVLALEAEPAMPDAVFVEDVAIVLDEIAVMTRPGAAVAARRGQRAWRNCLRAIAPCARSKRREPSMAATCCASARTLYVGESGRSNAEGMAQLQAAVAEFGYRVQAVPIRDCLHLKSAVTAVRDDTLLVQPAWVDVASFPGFTVIEVDPAGGACRQYPAYRRQSR